MDGYNERLLYHSRTLAIGVFRCQPWYPRFEEAGEIREGHLVVFPRTSVIIHQEGSRPLLADPNTVVFYNQSQPYRREKVSERGDFCDYFAYSPEILRGALEHHNPAGAERADDRPFALNHASIDAATYLLQRKVVEHLLSRRPPDPLFIQEASLQVLERSLAQAYHRPDPRTGPRSGTRREHRELALAAQSLLNQRFSESLTIETLASELYVSPYHLCRVFRRETGTTIHKYLHQLRLRTGLEYLLSSNSDLTTLALSLGFSSHSHFTRAVGTAFGLPPSSLQAGLQAGSQSLK